MPIQLSETEISSRAISLPAFPKIVNEIIQTLDDDNATLGALAHLVETDPVLTARIVSIANSAAMGGRNAGGLRNVHAAISLIGLARVRELALAVSLAEFAKKSQMSAYFWELVQVGQRRHPAHRTADHAGQLRDPQPAHQRVRGRGDVLDAQIRKRETVGIAARRVDRRRARRALATA